MLNQPLNRSNRIPIGAVLGAHSDHEIHKSSIDAAFRPLFDGTHPTSMAEQGLAAPQALFHSATRREVTPPLTAGRCYRCAKRHDAQPAQSGI